MLAACWAVATDVTSGFHTLTHDLGYYTGDASRPEFRAFARLVKDAKPVTARSLEALLGA